MVKKFKTEYNLQVEPSSPHPSIDRLSVKFAPESHESSNNFNEDRESPATSFDFGQTSQKKYADMHRLSTMGEFIY